jgi:hypothetical protein
MQCAEPFFSKGGFIVKIKHTAFFTGILAILLVFGMTAVSCGGDDDGGGTGGGAIPSELVGTWEIGSANIVINANGTGEDLISDGTWSVSGDTLSFNGAVGKYSAKWKIEDGKLVISESEEDFVLPDGTYTKKGGSTNGGGNSKPATAVAITEGAFVSVAVGGTITLHATVTPTDSTDTVAWSSSDTNTATVNASSGVVTGVAAGGSATITAKAGEKTATIIILVTSAGGNVTFTLAKIDARTFTLTVDGAKWKSNVDDGSKTFAMAINLTVVPAKTSIWSPSEVFEFTKNSDTKVTATLKNAYTSVSGTISLNDMYIDIFLTTYTDNPNGNGVNGTPAGITF